MNRIFISLTGVILVASILLQNPFLFLLAVLLALFVATTVVWGRYALAGVTYTRKFGAPRMFVGEMNDLEIDIVNAKPLPLAWLKAVDEFPVEIELEKGTLQTTHRQTRRALTNFFSPRFYERVRKQYKLRALHRGVMEFGPVELSSGDMFGLRTQHEEIKQTDSLIVYPRVVPITALGFPAAYPFGDAKTQRTIAQDPLRLMNVRAYAEGDSPRFIHWKATARRGSLQTKVFEPSATPVSAIFLDVQTISADSMSFISEYLEFAITAAASVARALLDAREAVGLYSNAPRRNESAMVRLTPSRRTAQWVEILETLARINYLALTPLTRALRAEMSRLPFGTTIVVISAVVTDELIAGLWDAKQAGHPVVILAIGEHAPTNVPQELPLYWLGGRAAYERLEELDLR